MKFCQQFEINELYVCTNFEAISQATLVLRSKNRPASLAKKAVSVKHGFKYGKQYFMRYYVLGYLFIPTNPLLAAMKFVSFFFLFFLFIPFFFFFSP